MIKLLFLSAILVCSSFSFISPNQTSDYMFIMLRPLKACNGKCNNYELTEYRKKNAEECKKQEETCKERYKDTPTYYTIAPGEAAIYYKYYKFVTECDCTIRGVHKSTSVAAATEEMAQKVAEEKAKKPKAFHRYEVYSSWPR